MKIEKSQLKIGIILNYINLGLGNLIPIFYTPIMLSLLGQSEYGLYKLSSSITSYLSLISLGISSAVTRYLIKYRVEKNQEKEEEILGVFNVIFGVISIISFIVGLILVFNLKIWYAHSLTHEQLMRMQILVFLMACNMSISFLMLPYVSVATAHEKFIFSQLMNILATCIVPIINIIVLFMGFASIGMATVSLTINVISQLGYLLYVRYKLRIKTRYRKIPILLLKEILVFSFWVFVSNVAGQLYNSTDTVMIGSIPELATKGAAIYSIGIVFVNIVGAMSTGISSVLIPKTNRLVFSGKNEEELTDFSIQIGRIQAFIVGFILTGFVTFGQPFIYFYAGKTYLSAYWIALCIMLPNIIPTVQNICLNITIAQNKHRFRSIVYLGIAISNVIGTWMVLKQFGIIGAAFVTGVALFIGSGIIMNIYYWKKIRLNIPRFWKEVGKVFLIPILLCIITVFISNFINFYRIRSLTAGIIIYTIIFWILCWKFVMNLYEKSIIVDSVKGIINKILMRK